MTRPRRLRAKYPGQCRNCDAPVDVGQNVYWYGRGRVEHVDCETARHQHNGCTACGGSGSVGVQCTASGLRPCAACDGTGSRKVQEYARERSRTELAPSAEKGVAR